MQGGERTKRVINVQTFLEILIVLEEPYDVSHYEILLAAFPLKEPAKEELAVDLNQILRDDEDILCLVENRREVDQQLHYLLYVALQQCPTQ